MKVHVILSKTMKKIQNYKFSYFYNVDFINNSTLVKKKQGKHLRWRLYIVRMISMQSTDVESNLFTLTPTLNYVNVMNYQLMFY